MSSVRGRDSFLRDLERMFGRDPARAVVDRGKELLAQNVFRWLPVRVGKRRMFMNPSNTMSLFAYLLGTYEWREIRIIRTLVRPGDTALDIGANIGYYTLELSRLAGDLGVVHAFEPEPVNFQILRTNVAVNSLTNVTLHNYALADYEGDALLYRSKSNAGDYSLTPRENPGIPPVSVTVRRLDSLMGEIMHAPSLIKIDVQGSEPMVLRGGVKCLEAWVPRPSILVEFEPKSLIRAGFEAVGLLEALAGRNYRIYRISPAEVKRVGPQDHASYRIWAGEGCNLLAVPEESTSGLDPKWDL